MKKTYKKPETAFFKVALQSMIAASDLEMGGTAVKNNEVLSRDGGSNFWDDDEE